MNKQWTSATDDAEIRTRVSAEMEAAELADTLLVNDLALASTLVTYLVRVGQHREAAGLLNDSDRQRLREVEAYALQLMETLEAYAALGSDENILDGGEQ